MGAPLPWFPFYINDWQTDERVKSLTFEERGIFLEMLCQQWREGSLPRRSAEVGQLLGVRATKVQRLLRLFFVPDSRDSMRVVNPKLAEVYCHQLSKSETASRVAREAASKRAARVQQTPSKRRSNADRVRLEIQTEIQKSLSAHADDNGKGEVA